MVTGLSEVRSWLADGDVPSERSGPVLKLAELYPGFEPDFYYRFAADKRFVIEHRVVRQGFSRVDISAAAKVDRYVAWRAARSYLPPQRILDELAPSHMHYLRSVDGSPALFIQAAKHKSDTLSPDEFENFFCEVLDLLICTAPPAARLPQFRLVVDMRNVSPRNPFAADTRKDMRSVEIMNKFYPGCLSKLVFVRCPTPVARSIAMITPSTWRERIDHLGGFSDLARYFDNAVVSALVADDAGSAELVSDMARRLLATRRADLSTHYPRRPSPSVPSSPRRGLAGAPGSRPSSSLPAPPAGAPPAAGGGGRDRRSQMAAAAAAGSFASELSGGGAAETPAPPPTGGMLGVVDALPAASLSEQEVVDAVVGGGGDSSDDELSASSLSSPSSPSSSSDAAVALHPDFIARLRPPAGVAIPWGGLAPGGAAGLACAKCGSPDIVVAAASPAAQPAGASGDAAEAEVMCLVDLAWGAPGVQAMGWLCVVAVVAVFASLLRVAPPPFGIAMVIGAAIAKLTATPPRRTPPRLSSSRAQKSPQPPPAAAAAAPASAAAPTAAGGGVASRPTAAAAAARGPAKAPSAATPSPGPQPAGGVLGPMRLGGIGGGSELRGLSGSALPPLVASAPPRPVSPAIRAGTVTPPPPGGQHVRSGTISPPPVAPSGGEPRVKGGRRGGGAELRSASPPLSTFAPPPVDATGGTPAPASGSVRAPRPSIDSAAVPLGSASPPAVSGLASPPPALVTAAAAAAAAARHKRALTPPPGPHLAGGGGGGGSPPQLPAVAAAASPQAGALVVAPRPLLLTHMPSARAAATMGGALQSQAVSLRSAGAGSVGTREMMAAAGMSAAPMERAELRRQQRAMYDEYKRRDKELRHQQKYLRRLARGDLATRTVSSAVSNGAVLSAGGAMSSGGMDALAGTAARKKKRGVLARIFRPHARARPGAAPGGDDPAMDITSPLLIGGPAVGLVSPQQPPPQRSLSLTGRSAAEFQRGAALGGGAVSAAVLRESTPSTSDTG